MQRPWHSGKLRRMSDPRSSHGSESAQDSTENAAGVAAEPQPTDVADKPQERGGPAGPEPTRFGDWERKGRCIDF